MITAVKEHTPSNRRFALQFSLATLAAGFAAPAIAGTKSNPDAKLIRLGREFDYAKAEADRLADSADEIWSAAIERVDPIVDEIEALQARTLEGLLVKTHALAWCRCGQPVTAEELADRHCRTIDMELIAGILADLTAMGGAA